MNYRSPPLSDNYSNGKDLYKDRWNKLRRFLFFMIVEKMIDNFKKTHKIITVEFETRRSVETPNRRGRM